MSSDRKVYREEREDSLVKCQIEESIGKALSVTT